MIETDYPIAAPEGVQPAIFRAQIIQTMATMYVRHMTGVEPPFTLAEGHEAAMATWETDWETDPAPRTLEQAILEVEADLSYWNEE